MLTDYIYLIRVVDDKKQVTTLRDIQVIQRLNRVTHFPSSLNEWWLLLPNFFPQAANVLT